MTESEIIGLFWDRDVAALEITEREYKMFTLAIARRILGSNEDAEKCFNDTLNTLWNSIPPKRLDSLKAYIAKIIHNI